MPTNPLLATPAIVFPNFGPYLTYNEAVKSATAIRKGIANVPNAVQYANMQRVYTLLYEPICRKFGKLPVSSFFRSAALNKAIGGASNSAHLYGCAIDIDCDGSGLTTNKKLFDWCRVNLDTDQIILENPDSAGNPAWVHLGLSRDGKPNRHQVLRMIRQGGKVAYESM